MSKKVFFAFLFIFAAYIITACKMDLATDIYLSDITDLLLTTEQTYLSATIKFQNPGDESRNRIIEIMSTYFYEVENIRVEKIDYSDFLVADIKVPITLITDTSVNDDTPFQVSVYNKDNLYEVYLQLNKESWNELNQDIYTLTYQNLNIKEAGISFSITNDLKKTNSLSFASVYINGIPTPYLKTIELERKQSVAVTFSNVLQDVLSTNDYNMIEIFSMKK